MESSITETLMMEPYLGANVGDSNAIDLVVDLSQCSRKESDDKYEFGDLVWGKVKKNHSWWPGQIVNPSANLTDEAMKLLKKDGFLIEYFGDQKLAFNELHDIKPFRMNFCEMESKSNGEAFVRAVGCALREAARRVEFGLTCLCVSEEVCGKGKVKSQIVVSSGIRKESSRVEGGDRFSSVDSFVPDKTVDFLLDFVKDPFRANRLDVSKIGGQLSAFNRWKGYHQVQLNEVLDELVDENVIDSALQSKGQTKARGRPRKRKNLFDGGLSPGKKVRRLSELMSNGNESDSDVDYTPKKRSKKTKTMKSNGSGKRSQSQKQNQTADEFLSQICLAARNPIEGEHNLDSLVKFSSDFRNYRVRKNKNDEEIANQLETMESYEVTGVKDSYWTDMTIVPKSDFSTKPNEENSLTSLTFKFSNLDSVPPIKKLHQIYRRYGALRETETLVLKKKKCVRLVFERKCDAETAFSSSGKFSIFGSALVGYRINFAPKLRKTGAAGKKEVKSEKKLQSGK